MAAMNAKTPLSMMIVCGEASGDALGAKLFDDLKTMHPEVRAYGVAGPRMRALGVEAIWRAEDLAVMGFWEVLCHWLPIWRAWRAVTKVCRERKPAVLVLIDYPGFNIRLAKFAKRLGIKVCYYVSPQVWVWKEGRLDTLAKCVDQMMVLHAFEKPLYEAKNIPVAYVGHALMDDLQAYRRHHPLQALTACRIALLPGSRRLEVETLLPVMLSVACAIQHQHPGVRFTLCRSSFVDANAIESQVNASGVPVDIVDHDHPKALSGCDLALAASGTVTLELGVLGIPTIVLYRVSMISYGLICCLTQLRKVSLVNIIAKQDVFTECLQKDMNHERVLVQVLKHLEDQQYYQSKCDMLEAFQKHLQVEREKPAEVLWALCQTT